MASIDAKLAEFQRLFEEMNKAFVENLSRQIKVKKAPEEYKNNPRKCTP